MYEDENIANEFLKHKGKIPFRTPEGYFDSLEDRIMDRIKQSKKTNTTSSRIIKFLKPALGLAASLLLALLLVNSPINIFHTKTATTLTSTSDLLDDYSLNLGSLDDNALANVIYGDESSTTTINPEEVLAYLSSDLNEVEIYSEIQN